jgi:hypothetical protein
VTESSNSWSYDKARLSESLELFERDHSPTGVERDQVNDWLTRALSDPVLMGGEDDETGIFYARVPETNIAIVYVPNRDEMKIYIASIAR